MSVMMRAALVMALVTESFAATPRTIRYDYPKDKKYDPSSFVPLPKRNSPATSIVGGEDAAIGEFPWIVAILGDYPGTGSAFTDQYCAGVLIAPNATLTARTCLFDENGEAYTWAVDFLAGARSLSSWESESASFAGFTYSPQLVSPFLALTFVGYNATIAYFDPPVDLPYLTVASSVSETVGTLTGWGAVSNDDGDYPDILQVRDSIPLLDDSACDIYTGYFEDGERCAGFTTADVAGACTKDFGDPLIVENPAATTGYDFVGTLIRRTVTCAAGVPEAYFDPVSIKSSIDIFACGGTCQPWSAPDSGRTPAPTAKPTAATTPGPAPAPVPQPTEPLTPVPTFVFVPPAPKPTNPPVTAPTGTPPAAEPTLDVTPYAPTLEPSETAGPTFFPTPAPTGLEPDDAPSDSSCSCACLCPGGFGYDLEIPYQTPNATCT